MASKQYGSTEPSPIRGTNGGFPPIADPGFAKIKSFDKNIARAISKA
jgi:hypothetical protein